MDSTPDAVPRFFPGPPADLGAQVDSLVMRALREDRSLALLRQGEAESVAALFGVSAYVVAAARQRLAEGLAEDASGASA